ncbi:MULTISPECIES: glycosyltransferase [unclassified Arthrobacter]|uniref:glycosyltransferase family protein n=1 Tax=unclassified Arthrobacter TaxID=235627 RepID=UPI001E4A08B6|nr:MULTISPECIES: glycosyltransferase [unclassified Arthrobacter]MCC9145765.1 glycosyltransferase [Arthrobacter sp. zg-Y919]MDK1276994.1 glycosyltransferase [Arthrobacter sp. zg.Y919]WIB04078.1 glycosyltransferase [Arthrobacter sp. zg-Y919]
MASLQDFRTGLWHLRSGGPAELREWNGRRRAERGFADPSNARGVEAGWIGRGTKRRLSIPAATVPGRPPRRSDLTVGVILDEFSASAFAFEWNTVALDPAGWRQQLADQPLDLVFIESAWAGNNRLWRGKIAGPNGPAPQLVELLAFSRSQGIPTVFWNKEDPPHYEDFLPAAALFDHVFTSDVRKIGDYRRDLGHDNVDVLPFAAQPAIHNPARPKYGRHSRDIGFAGMYFAHKYPERREQMDLLLGGAMDAKLPTGLEIFSRKLGGDPNYQFPAPLDSRVVGSLSYPQMLSAYKAYKVFLNVNSVVDSPSMCARRIFEINAAGTPVISTPSDAVARFFTPDEVPVASTREEAAALSGGLVRNAEYNDRTVHRAQRRIWSAHTYAHRAETIVAAAAPTKARPLVRPAVSALVPTIRPHQVENVFRTLAAQQDVDVELVLLTHGFTLEPERLQELQTAYELQKVRLLTAGTEVSLGECLNRCVQAASGDIVAKMDDDDHYGPHYLSDQLHALEYSGADVVGKQAHYMHLRSSKAVILRFGHREHRYTDFVMGPTIVTRRKLALELPFPSLGLGEDTGFLKQAAAAGKRIYSADRFNYFQVREGSGHTWKVDDATLLASGDLRFYGEPNEHTDI